MSSINSYFFPLSFLYSYLKTKNCTRLPFCLCVSPLLPLRLPLLPLRLPPFACASLAFERLELSSKCYKQKQRSVWSWPNFRPRQNLPLPLLPVRCYKQKQRSLLSWPKIRPRQQLPLLPLLPLQGYEQRLQG
jgi:hypothetical protein